MTKYTEKELRMKLCEKEKEADYRHQVAIDNCERIDELQKELEEAEDKIRIVYVGEDRLKMIQKENKRLLICYIVMFIAWLIQFLAYIYK